MNGLPLVGRNVKVRANDFVQMDLVAHITYASESDRKLLLEMTTPVTISGVTYTHAVASPRLARDDLYTLLNTGILGCSVTWVSKDHFDQSKPLDLTWWRGGAAAVTDVMLD